MTDYFFMQFAWPVVNFPSLDLGFDSPHAGKRHFGGAILMFVFTLMVIVIGNKVLVAMMTSTYQTMKRDATLEFKFHRVQRVVYYASAPRETTFFFGLEYIAKHHESAMETIPQVRRLHFVGEPAIAPHVTCAHQAGHAHARIDNWAEALPWIINTLHGDDE